jgi:glucosylceramidase
MNRVWPQNALLTVDRGAKRLNATPAYYVFRHVSQYVDVGAKRVGTQGGDAVAFKNPDGSVVTVVFNSGGQAAQTTLSAAGKTVQFSVPGNGWATVNLPAQ